MENWFYFLTHFKWLHIYRSGNGSAMANGLCRPGSVYKEATSIRKLQAAICLYICEKKSTAKHLNLPHS